MIELAITKKNIFFMRVLEERLSARETELLEHLSKGGTNKLIAEQLHISPFTVKRHIENIYKKLDASNRVQLVEKARSKGLL